MPTECCAQRGRCHLPGEHQATGSASTYSITVADVDSEGDFDVLLGSVGSATNQVPLNAGDGTFSTSIRIYTDIKLRYRDIADIADIGGI